MASSAAFELVLELKDHASKGLGQAAQQGGFLKNALSFATGGAILGGITAIGKAAGDMFGDAIEEAKEWNTGLGQLDAVLTSTGGKAGLTRDEILGLNKSLSAGGGFSAVADDAVLSGQNMLLTFTNIGEGVMPDATKAMLDMATAMNNGVTPSADQLNSTSIQLGKALNDPIKGISALSRVGVTFTDQQKDQIKAMVEAGDTMGAQKLILGELSSEFGGSATAAMSSFAGQQALMGEQFNNIKQTIGEALMPVLSGLTSFVSTTLMPAFEAGAAIFGDLVNYFRLVVTDGDALNDFLTHLPEPLQPIIQFIGEIVANFRDFFAAIQAGQNPLEALGNLIGGNLSAAGDLLSGVIDWVANVGLPLLITKLTEWGGALINWIIDSLPGWLQKAGEFIGGVLQWIGEQVPPLLAKLAEWGGAFVGWVLESLPVWLEKAGEFIGGVINWLVEQIPVLVGKLAEWAKAFIDWIVPQIPGMLSKLGEFIGSLLGWIIEKAPEIIGKLLEWAGAFLGWVLPMIPQLLLNLGQLLLDIGKWIITDALPAIVTKLGEWAKAFLDWIGTSVLPFLGGKLGEIWTAITEWIKNTARDIWNKVQEIGSGIVNGIKEGIANAWDSFTSWIAGKLNEWWTNTLAFFGIKSPSRLAAEQIGEPIVQGIQVGWEGAFPGLMGTVAGDLDRLSGYMAQRAAEIAAMMHNLQMSGSATSSGTGAGMWDTGNVGGGSTGGMGGVHALAAGGIVTRPIRAIVGEGGPEAVIPLDRWGGRGGMGGNTYHFHFGNVIGMAAEDVTDMLAEKLYDLTVGR